MSAGMARPAESDEVLVSAVRLAAMNGDTGWIMNKPKLANMMAAASTTGIGRTSES